MVTMPSDCVVLRRCSLSGKYRQPHTSTVHVSLRRPRELCFDPIQAMQSFSLSAKPSNHLPISSSPISHSPLSRPLTVFPYANQASPARPCQNQTRLPSSSPSLPKPAVPYHTNAQNGHKCSQTSTTSPQTSQDLQEQKDHIPRVKKTSSIDRCGTRTHSLTLAIYGSESRIYPIRLRRGARYHCANRPISVVTTALEQYILHVQRDCSHRRFHGRH
ncbi:hypothetical protein IWZ03DRAFT_234054 [Phyllosticta citriasiana]|uniref:Uncharacterized protein n=1 Tax=Phyllosticta citriasiana TaxID=595635 RepID=A0ABR1KL96_9PEZI